VGKRLKRFRRFKGSKSSVREVQGSRSGGASDRHLLNP